jgi:hypothetical protein
VFSVVKLRNNAIQKCLLEMESLVMELKIISAKRGKKDARKLWEQIPDPYKGESNFFTDLHDAYKDAFPEVCLYQVEKKVG